MVLLPPIKDARGRRNKKPFTTHIESSIFKNGLTWFDIDSVMDPFNLTRQRYVPLHKQTEEYINSKSELANRRVVHPLKSDFDKVTTISRYAQRNPFRRNTNVPGIIRNIENIEKHLERQWKTLEHDELDFRASVTTYNKFIIENKQKRETSHRKIAYFKSRSKALARTISKIRISINFLQDILAEMKENYKNHRIYHIFCTDAAHLEGLNTPLLLIRRYLDIKSVETFVFDRLLTMVRKYVSLYIELKRNEADRNNVLHTFLMQFNELKRRYEEVSISALKSQQFCSTVRDKCQNLMKCAYQTNQGIYAIFKYIQAKKRTTSHLPFKKETNRPFYISREIKNLEKMRNSTINIKKDEEIQEPEEDISFSSFEVNINQKKKLLAKKATILGFKPADEDLKMTRLLP